MSKKFTNSWTIIQSFRKFLAGGQFRRFKINQFEKIIKFLLSSFLLFTSPSLRGFVLISFCPREKFGQKMGFLPGAQETLIPSLIRS
jgi:hypothetical protein